MNPVAASDSYSLDNVQKNPDSLEDPADPVLLCATRIVQDERGDVRITIPAGGIEYEDQEDQWEYELRMMLLCGSFNFCYTAMLIGYGLTGIIYGYFYWSK